MAQRVKFGDVRSESIQETGRPLGSYMGTSSREDPRNKSYRAENSQTKKNKRAQLKIAVTMIAHNHLLAITNE